MRTNYYSSREVRSVEVIRKGFEAVFAEAVKQGKKKIWLVSNAKSNLEGYLAEAIGQGAASELAKGKALNVEGIQIVFYGEKTLPYGGDDCPVLVCYPSKKLLDKLDGMKDISSLVVLPWLIGDVSEWANTHGATDIFGVVKEAKSTVSNPVVERALEHFKAVINWSTGISHPSDKASAIEIFRILRAAREPYTTEEVRAWLVQKGMKPDHANAIEAIAADPSKHRSKGIPAIGDESLKRWREEENDD
jgi:hypothetical protein